MVLFMIPMHVTNLNAESDPKVSDAGWSECFYAVKAFRAGSFFDT